MLGGHVCASHGGKAPAVIAKARQRVAHEEAAAYVRHEAQARGPMTLGEVYEELLKTARLTVQWRDLLERVLADMKGDWRYTAFGAGTEQLRSEVALFERAMTRSAKVLELVARLDIDARATALSARQGELVASAVQRIIDGLNLTPAQLAKVPHVVPAELRRIVVDQVG